MFVSTGSNFGAPVITFQDYQNQHEVVLNAVFEYRSDSAAYAAAEVLEIYVPDLSLEKSALAGVFFAAKVQGNWIGSTLKCWIKDKNTICVEKPTPWDEYEEHKIWFCSLFGKRGVHGHIVDTVQRSGVSLRQSQSIGYISNAVYLETENWIFLSYKQGTIGWGVTPETVDEITNYVDFPADIDLIVPYPTGKFRGMVPGCNIIDAIFKDSKLTVTGIPDGLTYGTGYEPFFYAFMVRHTAAPAEENSGDDNSIEVTV